MKPVDAATSADTDRPADGSRSTSGPAAASDGADRAGTRRAGDVQRSSTPKHEPASLRARFEYVRTMTEALTEGLAPEDLVVQSMEEVSPTKWHLAHTSWFWETFVLSPHAEDYRLFDPRYPYLFNSYYVQAGERHCRAQRGYLSRPTVQEVLEYRHHVDEAMSTFLARKSDGVRDRTIEDLVELGMNHEQQHQELMLTDLKHVFSVNPLRPTYRSAAPAISPPAAEPDPIHWIEFDEGVQEVGWSGNGFHFDNEAPRHRSFLEAFALADRPATNAEYLAFMEDGGYERPELWMSEGWAKRETDEWTAPFYWERREGEWWSFTLSGMRPVDPLEPVCHLTWFEADAFARWHGARLPREDEWEVAARGCEIAGNFMESGRFHPSPARSTSEGSGPRQMFGDVWEWTSSAYSAYPGYRPPEGAIGEYNAKFMCGQFVLRGGSCATPVSHIRPTYRNFFHPDAAWQFSGVRLARDLES